MPRPASAWSSSQRGERCLAIGVDPARGLVEHEQVGLGDGDRGERRGARARRSRDRADDGTSRTRGRTRSSAAARPHLVTADAERDLVDRGLAHEVAAGILREVRRAADPGREPASGSSSPAAIFASVVLPLPFRPSSATISPRLTVSETHRAPRARRRRRSGRRRAGRAARRASLRAEPDRAARARPRSAAATPRARRAPPRPARRGRCGPPPS